MVVYRLDDRLVYTNASYVHARVLEAIEAAKTPTRWLVLDAESIPQVDATGVETLERLLDDLDRLGVELVIARLKTPLRTQLDRTGLTDRVGRVNLMPNVERAVRSCADRMEADRARSDGLPAPVDPPGRPDQVGDA